jgi:hypothetical protein
MSAGGIFSIPAEDFEHGDCVKPMDDLRREVRVLQVDVIHTEFGIAVVVNYELTFNLVACNEQA